MKIENNKLLIKIENLTKSYIKNIKAIENVSFDIFEGNFHVFIGANGSGKTTTIKCLISAYNNWTGEIKIKGFSNRSADAKMHLGYMPEKDIFPPSLTISKFLNSLLIISGWKKEARKKRVDELLEFLNLTNFKNKYPNDLSSGQKRKVLLAQALINDPKILIMDEPTTNLDPVARRELFDILNQLREQGTTIFVSTHDLYEVSRFANYVTIINQGNIVYSGIKTSENLEDMYFKYVNYDEMKIHA